MAAAAWLLLFAVPRALPGQEASTAALPVPPRAYSLPKQQIPESFLGYLVGLIDADVPFSLNHDDLLSVLPEFKGRKGDPFDVMKQVSRRPPEDSDRGMALAFTFPDDLVIPLPVGIFGYHPITVSVSRLIVMEERRYPSRIVGSAASGAEILFRDYEYRVSQGHARFHFDDWLVFLSGGFLQDFSVDGAAIFQDRGEWRALIAGRGVSRPVICWLFDLLRMRLVLSVPGSLQDLASELVP